MVHLLAANRAHLETILSAPTQFKARFGYGLAENVTMFPEAISFMIEHLSDTGPAEAWGTQLAVLQEENKVIGLGGYKGKPNGAGFVEIGYEIAPAYRGRGLATAFAAALIENALKNAPLSGILAHTLPERNASVRVLEKNGFQFIQAVEDPDDGLIWAWKRAVG